MVLHCCLTIRLFLFYIINFEYYYQHLILGNIFTRWHIVWVLGRLHIDSGEGYQGWEGSWRQDRKHGNLVET